DTRLPRRHQDRQHLLVNVYCCDSICHHASPWAERRACQKVFPGRGTWLSPLPKETNDAQLFAQSAHAPDQTESRPRLLHCPNDLTARTIAMMPVFHQLSRAEGPSQQGRITNVGQVDNRLATCAAVGYRRRSTAKAAGADCQSAAGYQPAPQNLVRQPTPAQFFMGFRG